ncbi:exopolysaccharide transport family protein [Hoeflea marina]|uniref:Exopolysaccharide transport family protein n=1 Tax=Hoeflea marina TaxID=274592 RepID=A0A317PS71_9HYPH|nr:exopolysaccharide transport family protein [Hoeflea marina]PWW03454.1 exopolysaccharide transport family protein [Hoeflea marina]
MSGANVNQADVDIDLGHLVSAIWIRKRGIALATVLAAGLAFAVTGLIHPLYKSETRILIEAREPVYSRDQNQARPTDTAFDERSVTSQVEVLRSTDLLKDVATRLDLASRPEFDPAASPSAIGDALVLLGLKKDPLEVPASERVLKEFTRKLEVYAVPQSRVIVIEFSSRDAGLAAAVPNALAETYLAFNAGAKVENNSDASAWLEPEIARLRLKVREAEEKVAAYRSEKGLLLVNEKDTISAKQLSDISTELSRVRAEAADADARARAVRNTLERGGSIDAISDVLGSPLVQRLRETEGNIRSQLADLSTTLLDNHPRMRALRAQLADIERQVLAETRKVLSGLENNAKLGALREEELVSQINSLKAGSAREGEETVQLRSLERDAASQRDLLETYLARYRESASRSEPRSTPADARVISQAVPASESYYPKTVPIIIVAALAALLLSSIWVMLSELFSGRALRPVGNLADDADFDAAADAELGTLRRHAAAPVAAPVVERFPDPEIAPAAAAAEPAGDARLHAEAAATVPLAAPVAAAVPAAARRPAQDSRHTIKASLLSAASPEVSPAPASGVPDGADFTVEAVADQLLADETALAICVSPEGDEGSATAVMLARTVAGEGARILLIDLTGSGCPTDLMAESPRLPGLTDLLCGEISIADAIHGDRLSEAQIIPRGNANGRRAMRAIERLPMILNALTDTYDLVIVECGPADAASVARIARVEGTEIILSVVRPDEDTLLGVVADFHDQGFTDLLLMSSATGPGGPDTGRRSVA